MNHDVHYHLDNDTEVVDGQLPGTENLNEKALPLSHLFATGMNNLLANNNLAEKSQIPQRLPGIKNLAEKRILDVVLKKLTQFPEMKEKSNLSLVKRERERERD